MIQFSLISVLAITSLVHSLPTGPPTRFGGVCDRLQPGAAHGPNPVDAGNGGFVIATNLSLNTSEGFYTYNEGIRYTVQIQANTATFRGFIVQARDPSDEGIGTFETTDTSQQILQGCSPVGSTIAHSNTDRLDFSLQTFIWNAPAGNQMGLVNFFYTIVETQPRYYRFQNATAGGEIALMEGNVRVVTAPEVTNSLTFPTAIPARAPEDYRLTIRVPDGCDPSDCEMFLGISTNTEDESFLDVHMQADAQAWVAVGFSETKSMFDADVLGCNVNPDNSMIEALDAWNPEFRGNRIDQSQDVRLLQGAMENGRITCTLVRSIVGTEESPQRDLDLNQEYYVMFGIRPDGPTAGRLEPHNTGPQGNPSLSAERINPATSSEEIGISVDVVRERLTRAHGILMIIAWPVLAVTAIFFAAYMRPALPNGEWFQVHRVFMIASLLLGASGFILIFVANRNNSTPGLISLGSGQGTRTVHFAFGIFVLLLQIINPIIALFRCHPGTKNRWIFNLVHGSLIGYFVQSFALTNVGIGIGLFSSQFSHFEDLTIFWVFLAWLFWWLLCFFGLLIFSIFSRKKSKESAQCSSCKSEKSQRVELEARGDKPDATTADNDKDDQDKKEKKEPSRDSPIRWAILGVYLAVMLALMIVMIVLVAI